MSGVALRPATREDARLIYRWRTDARTLRFWHDPRAFDFETHLRWFDRLAADPADHLWLGTSGGEPVGVLRLTTVAYGGRLYGETGIYLDPERHGRGLGTALLRALPGWCRQAVPEVSRLTARVQEGNAPSLRVFAKAGFVELPWRVYGGLPPSELIACVGRFLDAGQAPAPRPDARYAALWREAAA